MKYLKDLLVAGFVLIFTSSYTTRTSGLKEGLNPGNLIPDFCINEKSENEVKISDFRGEKILVNLWAAHDAKSHMQNVLLANAVAMEKYPVKMVSVAFDESRQVFEKTISMDGITNEFQFVDTLGNSSEVYQKYELDKGFKSYLIDEEGMILAVNVTKNDLKKVLEVE